MNETKINIISYIILFILMIIGAFKIADDYKYENYEKTYKIIYLDSNNSVDSIYSISECKVKYIKTKNELSGATQKWYILTDSTDNILKINKHKFEIIKQQKIK